MNAPVRWTEVRVLVPDGWSEFVGQVLADLTEGGAAFGPPSLGTEPPPEGHWLYTHPRVRLSPHISWSMPGALEILLEPFLDNLARFRAGRPLLARDLVDVERRS